MSSGESSTPLNPEADLPTRPEDVLALRHARQGPLLSLTEYLEFLAQLQSLPLAIRQRDRDSRADTPFEL
jgi:hypothetical protein